MNLITFIIEIIIAYFLGQILAFAFVIFAGALIAIGAGIYFAFKWIIAHLPEITAIIGLIAGVIYLLIFIKRKRLLPRAYQAVKSRLSVIGVKIKRIINVAVRPIKEWNEKHKPKDIKSMRRYGAISFLIGVGGAITFYIYGFWYVSLFYLLWIISGIYQMLYPQKALEEMRK